jgi:caa(3)-type oxidase subunit IV
MQASACSVGSGVRDVVSGRVFMHETEARALTRLASALGFLWLSMLLTLALLDYLTRSPVRMPWQ